MDDVRQQSQSVVIKLVMLVDDGLSWITGYQVHPFTPEVSRQAADSSNGVQEPAQLTISKVGSVADKRNLIALEGGSDSLWLGYGGVSVVVCNRVLVVHHQPIRVGEREKLSVFPPGVGHVEFRWGRSI